jgi:2-polyprenylphenol 6-hydroxylase
VRTNFDVIVVGGGLVGAACAALLATDRRLQALRIGVLDARPPTSAPADRDIDLRVSSVSRATERILTSVGAWQNVPTEFRCPYDDMVVWDAQGEPDGEAALRFAASETSEPNLGYIIENRRLLWSIYDSAAFKERVTLIKAELTNLTFDDEAAEVTLSDGRRVSASLVIGADGGASTSRKLAGIATTGHAYEQAAFVTHVKTERPHQRTAWQRFLPEGPIAFLPLADGRSSIVWTVTPDHAKRLIVDNPVSVGRELTEASDTVLGQVEVAAGRASFPLHVAHADHYCRERFVLIGDAAHAVHPLAGQGVNLGFLDAAALAQVVGDAIAQGGRPQTLGEMRLLRRYERWRKSENALALGLIDGLNRLFSNSNSALGALRRGGFTAINRSRLAKRMFIERALGVAGEVPDVVRQR